MTARASDRLLGAILIAVSVIWCWVVLASIPPSDWAPVGARGFPLAFGIILGVLGAVVVFQSFASELEEDDKKPEGAFGDELWAVAMTIGMLVVYTLLLKYTGFLIGTFLAVAIVIGGVLRIWRPGVLLGTAVGLSLGIYLIMGKLLGVYLPNGTWVNLVF